MAKQGGAKEQARPKSLKDQKKELEARLFGEKNNAKKKEIMGMLKKVEIAMKQESEARQAMDKAKKAQLVKQLIPVGVDPKTVQCVNFINGVCDKGENCQFSHSLKKPAEKAQEAPAEKRPRALCRFLVDAINSGEYGKEWVCPFPGCSDIHKLVELGADSSVEVSLEEYIELQRQTIDDTKHVPLTKETFNAWRERKDREEELHAKRVAAMSTSVRGVDLFKLRPELFEDDEEVAADVDYKERNYEDFEEEGGEGAQVTVE